jgi:hypothetical protein
MEIRFKLEKETKGGSVIRRSTTRAKSSSKRGLRSARSICARARLNVVCPSRRCYVLPSIPLEFQKLRCSAVSPPPQSSGLTSTASPLDAKSEGDTKIPRPLRGREVKTLGSSSGDRAATSHEFPQDSENFFWLVHEACPGTTVSGFFRWQPARPDPRVQSTTLSRPSQG